MRHVFFSFHYQRDIWRANVVRNSWVRSGGIQAAGYRDLSMWEAARTKNDQRLAGMIRSALHGTSVTAVLIGAETASRYWVWHEIVESWKRGNGLMGVRIHRIADSTGRREPRAGPNPFRGVRVRLDDGRIVDLSTRIQVYDWWHDDGQANFGSWVEDAAREAGRQ